MTVAQKSRNPDLEASRWFSWKQGEEWFLPPGLVQKRSGLRPCGWETARKQIVSPGGWGVGWNGVGSIWRNILHSLTKVSGGEASICYFREGVNFLPVPFLEGSVVRTLLAYLCSLFAVFSKSLCFFLFHWVYASKVHQCPPLCSSSITS